MDFVNEKLIEFNNYLRGRKVAVIGLGVSNIPLIDYLHDLKYRHNCNHQIFEILSSETFLQSCKKDNLM